MLGLEQNDAVGRGVERAVGERSGLADGMPSGVPGPELPKTRSGKIMRRLLRDVAENRPLGDTTTLADPAVVSEFAERASAAPEEA